jgi:hypothetical protein
VKFGADRKKLIILGALVLVGGYFFYSNVLSGPSSSSSDRPSVVAHTGPVIPEAPHYGAQSPVKRRPSSKSQSGEFRPSLLKRPEDRIDPMSIDPTLRLDLLAKVQAVEMQGGARNLFQFSTAPPPPLPKEPLVKVAGGPGGKTTAAPPPGPPQPPPAPAAPPILLKYYGYSSARGDNRKHAFFLDGDEILVAGEGDMVKKRYRVVRIGVNSVVMEDTQFKHEQTLPLQEEAAG